MRPSDLKYELLEWLYLQYKHNPNGVWDIAPLLEDGGITQESAIIEYGYALKNAGFLKQYSGSTLNSFTAAIDIKGIDLISEDVKKEVYQLLEGIKDDAAHFYPVVGHLQFLPKNITAAKDICRHMETNGLAKVRYDGTETFIKITELGISHIDPDIHPNGGHLRTA